MHGKQQMWTRMLAAGLVVVVAVAACGGGQPRPAAANGGPGTPTPQPAPNAIMPLEVLEITWEWVSFTTPVEEIVVDAPDRYTIRFDRAGRVAVRADCNRGTGGYRVTPDRRIEIMPLGMTRALCPAGSLSDRFVREVNRAAVYFVKGGELFLDLPVDSGTLRFRRMP